ncbi:MAG TPA: DUF6186 family protein [Micromonosporaceae bacterium]|jgi:hypothetical protein
MKAVILSLFALGAVAFVALSWLSRRDGSKVPGFGDMAGFVMAYRVGRVPVGRVAVLGFWWWLGWHFFCR